ncbi:hypothetical protein Mapa_003644 [Marchantia paleacea]|nr:hypothetical protein Mapa_003644 [Marchantia paleacea]
MKFLKVEEKFTRSWFTSVRGDGRFMSSDVIGKNISLAYPRPSPKLSSDFSSSPQRSWLQSFKLPTEIS